MDKTDSAAIKARFCRKNLLTAAAVSIGVFFTVYFFSSADLFLNNQNDFVVTWDKVILPMLGAAAAGSAAGFAFMCVMLLGKESWFNGVIKLGTGLLSAGYFQMLFLNGKMPQLSGDLYNTKISPAFIAADLVIFLLIAALPFILGLIKKKAGNKGILSLDGRTAAAFVCTAIFLMQAAGVAGSYAKNGIVRKDGISYNQYFSYEPSTHLSKDKNVVVFMCDKLDSFWMDDMLKDYPELNDSLDGFTFYQNNLSTGNYTFASVTEMLTGESAMDYDDEYVYIEEAWKKENAGDLLRQNGWKVDLHIGTTGVFSDLEGFKDHCDNVVIEEGEDNVTFLYTDMIIPTMTDLSLGRLVPYIIKNPLIDKSSSFSNSFYRINNVPDDAQSKSIGDVSDLGFYSYITEHPLTDDSDKPTYTFVHFNGCHDISDSVSALYSGYDGTEPDQYTTARGTFVIIEEYIKQLKELGLYDNTTIIILGDHGGFYDYYISKVKKPLVTALLIKPEGASGKLALDSESEMYNKYLPASLLEYAGLDHEAYGISFSDVTERGMTSDRILQTYHPMGDPYKPEKLKVTGDARDINNWEVLEHNE